MFHPYRQWSVWPVREPECLARCLTEAIWSEGTAFGIGPYLWLNDSVSPKETQVFAVLKQWRPGCFVQLESITFGWRDFDGSLSAILATLNGQDDRNPRRERVNPRLENADLRERYSPAPLDRCSSFWRRESFSKVSASANRAPSISFYIPASRFLVGVYVNRDKALEKYSCLDGKFAVETLQCWDHAKFPTSTRDSRSR